MKESTSKEKVLKKIRDALVDRMPAPFVGVDMESPLFAPPDSEFLEETFAKAFIKTKGKFIYCQDVSEIRDSLKIVIKQRGFKRLFCGEDYLQGLVQGLETELVSETGDVFSCDASITGCEALVARLGTIVCSSSEKSGRKAMVVPPVHIVIATNKQLVYSLEEAMRHLKQKYGQKMPSLISFITGPSRTADIEKTLVFGAHGPKELYLFMLDMKESDE